MTRLGSIVCCLCLTVEAQAQTVGDTMHAARTEVIVPLHKTSFNNGGDFPLAPVFRFSGSLVVI